MRDPYQLLKPSKIIQSIKQLSDELGKMHEYQQFLKGVWVGGFVSGMFWFWIVWVLIK